MHFFIQIYSKYMRVYTRMIAFSELTFNNVVYYTFFTNTVHTIHFNLRLWQYIKINYFNISARFVRTAAYREMRKLLMMNGVSIRYM